MMTPISSGNVSGNVLVVEARSSGLRLSTSSEGAITVTFGATTTGINVYIHKNSGRKYSVFCFGGRKSRA